MKAVINAIMLACILAGRASTQSETPTHQSRAAPVTSMQLGNFSISLTVKDIAASRAFYEKLGFRIKSGDQKQNWLVMQNDTATIGLFQGMFEKNSLCFNPGWDRAANTLPKFDDVREIQRMLKTSGIKIETEADEKSTGPAYITLTDPDGNMILIDQHVAAPEAPAAQPAPAPKP